MIFIGDFLHYEEEADGERDTDCKADKHWLPYMGKHDWNAITSALAELVPIAEKLNLKIGMENLFRKKPNGNFNYIGVLGTA